MNYLREYFNDDLSLDEWRVHLMKYSDYLNANKNSFDEMTFKMLSDGRLHDAKVRNLLLDGYIESDDEEDVYSNMTIIVDVNGKMCKMFYEKIKEFSLETIIEFNYGLEDILIDECAIEYNYFKHELVFVGERSWFIKCKNISISELL